jgi:hypothetical protein
MSRSLGAILCAAVLAAACSGKGTAPTSPSSAQPTPATPGGPTSQSTATITGNVRNASSSGTVSIAGTSMSAALDAAGRFTLGGVPAGDVQLQVNTAGTAGSVPIAAVLPAQTIEVVVAMGSGSATLESEVRHGAGEAELKGTITALPPTTPALTFTAAGKTVRTDSSTVFVSGSMPKTFGDLKVGMRVEVHGTLSGDVVVATRVEIENEAEHPKPEPEPAPTPTPPAPAPPTPTPPAPKPPEVELRGTIAGLTGSASAFQFTLGTTTVKGDATTRINGDDDDKPKTFADLENGLTVEVHGTQGSGFVQATRINIEEPDDENQDVELEGTLGAITGTCPVISSSVGATKFTTTASTRFDDAPCSAFKQGDKVEVKGTKNPDGSIVATRLERK